MANRNRKVMYRPVWFVLDYVNWSESIELGSDHRMRSCLVGGDHGVQPAWADGDLAAGAADVRPTASQGKMPSRRALDGAEPTAQNRKSYLSGLG